MGRESNGLRLSGSSSHHFLLFHFLRYLESFLAVSLLYQRRTPTGVPGGYPFKHPCQSAI